MPGRHCKILCTLGPASNTPEIVGALIDAGMNAVRLNFSHGTPDDHARVFKTVRREEPKIGRNDPCWCGSGKKFKKCHGA